MPNFTTTNTTAIGAGNVQKVIGTTYQSQIIALNSTTGTNTNLTSGTSVGILKRGKLYDMLVGTAFTPADNYLEWDVTRITAGTSSVLGGGISSVSSNLALDMADNYGFYNLVAINTSIETAMTPTVEVWYVGVNQRASYRWVAAPGSEIVWPANTSATGNNGIAGRARSGAGVGNVTMNWLWQEQ